MKKLKKPTKPKLPKVVKQPFRRAKAAEEKVTEALQGVPRITNETVAEHREEVLSSARKYIYPLQHSKHRVVRISIILLIVAILSFFSYCGLALYKFQSTSGFIYGVTRIIPFPVAKVGSHWVSYESYLFELRRNMHYYETQQRATFTDKTGKEQLKRLKQQALEQVIRQAYVDQLADEHHVSVSKQTVNNQVTLVRNQNRLGSNDRVFRDVLNQFWGWDENDFKRELKSQLLQQAVVAILDAHTNNQAKEVLIQLQAGGDFAALAKQYSQDETTKANGGQYAAAITTNDRNQSPAVIAAMSRLKPNEISPIINTGYSLEIIKVLTIQTGSVQAAHIQFNFEPITTYTSPLAKAQKPHYYIKF